MKKIVYLFLLLTCCVEFTSCRKNKDDEISISDGKIILETEVIDAEYSKKTDLLIYASSKPHQLHVYSTGKNTRKTIDLNFAPLSVAIALDGKTAVVGHDARISYIDLVSMRVTKVYDVSCEVFDIVLSPNNWVYAFPKRDQAVKVHCIELATGVETLNPFQLIRERSKAKIHPSGKYLYVADNGVSPSDIVKFDIQYGTAQYMYDSPYHGTYNIDGDLWFSEDGNRIFVKGRTVLKSSEVKTQDMVYNGTVPHDTVFANYYMHRSIIGLDHSQATNALYVINKGTNWDDPGLPFVYIHNALNLDYIKKIPLETYTATDNYGYSVVKGVEPLFVFVNAKGNRLFVITKSAKIPNKNEWAIQIINN